MLKVSITGGQGQLGKSLQALAVNIKEIEFLFCDSESLDVANASLVNEHVAKNKPDVIVNCAAYTQVDKAEQEQKKAHAVNVEGVRNLLESCRKYNVKLLQISTDYVFEGKSQISYKEANSCHPINYYGQSKYEAERLIAASEVQSVVLRTSWLYSEYGNNFLQTMLRLSKEQESINVVNDQWGSPTYAKDLAAIMMLLIKNFPKWKETYHFTNEGSCTWFDFASKIFNLTNRSCKLNPITTGEYPTLAVRPKYSVLCNEKIKNILGIEIRGWEEALEECMKNVKI